MKKKISKIIQKTNFDIVIHLAAYTKVGESTENPKNIMKIIMKVQKKIFLYLRKKQFKKFYFLFNWISLWKFK